MTPGGAAAEALLHLRRLEGVEDKPKRRPSRFRRGVDGQLAGTPLGEECVQACKHAAVASARAAEVWLVARLRHRKWRSDKAQYSSHSGGLRIGLKGSHGTLGHLAKSIRLGPCEIVVSSPPGLAASKKHTPLRMLGTLGMPLARICLWRRFGNTSVANVKRSVQVLLIGTPAQAMQECWGHIPHMASSRGTLVRSFGLAFTST